MLDHVHIENFRCLKSVDVPMRPLTVLIGPNDSGKSAFLAALDEVGDAQPGRVFARDTRRSEWDIWKGDPKVAGPWLVTARAGKTIVTVSHNAQAVIEPRGPNPVSPAVLFLLPASGVATESAGVKDHAGAPQLERDGSLLAAFIDYLLRQDRSRFDDIGRTLHRLIPGFETLNIRTPAADKRRIELVVEGKLKLPGDRASVGVRLMLFFVALAYHPNPPKLILIEEPENGVHPKRLADIIRLLREITEGKHGGHAAQVVLTTHSPHLLDQIDVTKDQVLIFRRNEDGSRTAEPADEERLKIFLDEFMLGEVWDNEGEAGLLRRKE